MLDPKKFNPPPELVSSHRAAILNAAHDAQALKDEPAKTQVDLTPYIPARGFPIVLTTPIRTTAR
jgi:hypothetical protein